MSEETAICTICRQPLGIDGRCQHCDEDTHVWSIQDWRPLLKLSLMIVLGFSFTTLVVRTFRENQSAQAERYYAAGNRALEAQHPADAVDAFETALIYSRNNFEYRLKLTDALLASGATSEALGQLKAFYDQHPGDAYVNLKLARVEAQQKHPEEALGYYQNAIDGMWPERSDPVPQRLAVRFEAAEYLVEEGRQEQAEAALLALEAALPSNSTEQGRLANLFLRNGDPGRALSAYQVALNLNRHDVAAVLGAAKASFSGGNYSAARRYLEEVKPETAESKSLLEQLQRMEALDPFSPGTTVRVRTERTMAAFRIAIDRLAGCGVPFAKAMSGGGAASAGTNDPPQWSSFAKWAEQLSPMMSERKLQGRDDAIESTMRFAFQAEMAAEKSCGKPTLNDEALLLLAHERLGANR
jgi:tetratricopeptide (TPR) repeat protein